MTYDIAIVGAGPAGSTLARLVAERCPDMRIVIIDAQATGRPKVCGGLLSEGAQLVMARLGLTLPSEVLSTPQIFSVDVIDLCSRITTTYPKNYLNMDRLAFDRWLLSLVPSNVERINGKCTSVSRREGGFSLSVLTPEGRSNMTAAAVVGADGASSVVRRSLFKREIYRYVSIQQWFKNPDTTLPGYSCVYDRKTSDSCSWTIRKGEYFIFGGAFPKEGCRAAFDEQRARLEKHLGKGFGEPTVTEACMVCSPRRRRDMVRADRGAYLIGEAAGFISPSSFEGISSAMLSAKHLSDAIAEGAADAKRTEALYRKYSAPLVRKIRLKVPKMRVLSSPMLRDMIMRSGIAAIKKFDK